MKLFIKIFVGIFLTVTIAGGFLFVKRNALLQSLLPRLEEIAARQIKVKVKVGTASIDDFEISSLKDSALIVKNIEVFDRNDELMAKVDNVRVTAKLLNFYDDGAGAIDEIDVDGAQLFLKKRDDDTWNIQDIKLKSENESTFDALINLAGGTVNAEFDGKNISVENIHASADCADSKAIKTKISATTLGSQITASGTVNTDRQIINAFIDTADIEKILPYLPEGILSENIEIHGGKAKNTAINILRRGDILSYSGFTDFQDGAVRIEETEIKNIKGTSTFTDAEYIINASAEANGQFATVSGSVRTDTDELFFDVNASSDNFTPSAIIENIGIDGAAAFTAHVFGTVKDPKVEADISSDYLGYEDISARNVKTHLRYVNNAVYLSKIYAETFGGSVTGEVEVAAEKLSYNAHIKANGINLAQVLDPNFEISGSVNADVALNGIGTDFNTVKIFGEVNSGNILYKNFLVNSMESSFYLKGRDIQFDYLNLKLPNNGTINLEGTVKDVRNLDMNFYGAHVDLSLAKNFDSIIDLGGLSDFGGSINGNLDNPQVALTLSAVDSSQMGGIKGQIFQQEYDSLKMSVSGSMDAINVDSFEMEKDGNLRWKIMDGTVNFKNHTLNVRLDTIGARLENIMALVAPDQDIAGEVDNTIRVRGTFENPELVGYVEFKYGRYRGILLTGMRGDYFLEGDNLRLQDFLITSPMVDMVLNGTINRNTYDMDFVVAGRDINLRRFQSQFPYEVGGHATFEGLIQGSLEHPIFNGQLNSSLLSFNGVELTDITGHIRANGTQVVLDDFKFKQDEGTYDMYLSADSVTKNMSGRVNVENVNIGALVALANHKIKKFNGNLTSSIEIGGNLDNPTVRLTGEIPKALLSEYDLHGILLDVNLINHVANINQLRGFHGENGEFEFSGSANLNGDLNLVGNAKNIELGMIGAAAGSNSEFVGTTDLNLKIGGDINNPTGDLILSATGGIRGSTFDLLRGHITFKDWIFNVEDLTVERAVGEKVYRAGAKGIVPIEALYIENNNPTTQMNLVVSLDEADLSLLPVVSNMVAWATGEMAGNLTMTGTLSDPQINGAISLKEGTVKIKGLKNLVENINISTKFAGDEFTIENFAGNMGKGNFALTGGLNFANFAVNNYAFNFVANALDIQSDFFSGPLNAEFSLAEEKTLNRNLPKLAGHVDLEKCLLSIPAIPDSDDPLPEILLDFEINLGDKVHFYSSRLYNMFLNGSVKYEGLTNNPKPSGIISVKRGGTINYLSTVFDVKEGELHFNQMGSFFPSLNFKANARVSDIRVELSVSGTLNNAQVKLTSNPEKTETEIMQILTLRDAYGNQTSNMSMADVLAIGLQMSILGDIEDSVKRTLGLDRFIFSSGSGSALDSFSGTEVTNNQNEEFNISIGKYVTDKLMLKYTQGINGDKVTRYGIQYDLNDNIGINIEREKSEFIFSLEAQYKF